MAINITTFSSSEGKDPALIGSWFDQHKNGLFDSVSVSGSNVNLIKDQEIIITIHLPDGSLNTVCISYVLADGTIRSTGALTTTNGKFIQRLAVTSSGIAIAARFYDHDCPWGCFISKTAEGSTGIIYSNGLHFSGDADAVNYQMLTPESKSCEARNLQTGVASAQLTTLSPAVCAGTKDYFPNCFVTNFTQYRATDCVLNIDGTKYLYNGYMAMKE